MKWEGNFCVEKREAALETPFILGTNPFVRGVPLTAAEAIFEELKVQTSLVIAEIRIRC